MTYSTAFVFSKPSVAVSGFAYPPRKDDESMLAHALLYVPAALLFAAQPVTKGVEGSEVPAATEAPASEADATPAEAEAPPASSETDKRAPQSNLERGLALFQALEFEVAKDALEAALKDRDHSRDDLAKLYATLGVVRAYLEDPHGARAAFDSLLAIAPGHTLPYTTSPKATFVFEKARTEAKTRRALELRFTPPKLQRLDEPIVVEVARTADPFKDVSTVELWHRKKGADKWEKLTFDAPAVGKSVRAKLPAVTEADAFVDEETGSTGAYVEVAVVGRSALGWELFRGPDRERPFEIPVGFDAPGPWYTTWWFWSGTVAVAATSALVTGSAVAAAVLLKPENVPVQAKREPL